jgi:hypothetical protein
MAPTVRIERTTEARG